MLIFKCDSKEIIVPNQAAVKDIFPPGNSSCFVIKQTSKPCAKHTSVIEVKIPREFDGEYYLRDEEDSFRIIANVPAGLSMQKTLKDGKVEFVKGDRKLKITEDQFNRLVGGEFILDVCPKLSQEDRRFLVTGMTDDELKKLVESKKEEKK